MSSTGGPSAPYIRDKPDKNALDRLSERVTLLENPNTPSISVTEAQSRVDELMANLSKERDILKVFLDDAGKSTSEIESRIEEIERDPLAFTPEFPKEKRLCAVCQELSSATKKLADVQDMMRRNGPVTLNDVMKLLLDMQQQQLEMQKNQFEMQQYLNSMDRKFDAKFDAVEKAMEALKRSTTVVGDTKTASSVPAACDVVPSAASSIIKNLPFQGNSFDQNGLMYFIGTRGGTKTYVNPHKLGPEVGVVVTMSSCHFGEVSRVVNYKVESSNFTENLPSSWISIDIGAGRKMQVTHYCLRSGHGGVSGYALRNWLFQGSNNCTTDGSWTNLMEHVDDQSQPYAVAKQYTTASWRVPNNTSTAASYRYFRIMMTGNNSNGNAELHCLGFELYGTLTEESVRRY